MNQAKNKLEKITGINSKQSKSNSEFNLSSLLKSKTNSSKFAITAVDKDGNESVFSNFADMKFDQSAKKWDCKIKEEL